VGSQACERCHASEYAKWRDSFHSRTLYDAVPATVFGDFSGARVFDDPDFAVSVLPYSEEDPSTGTRRHFMKIRLRPGSTKQDLDTYGGGVPEKVEGTFEVLYAFGNRRHQPYVARWPDGRYWVLPVFWNDVEKSWRYDGFRPYVESCATCHTTGIRSSERPWFPGQPAFEMSIPPRFNLPPGEEGWAEGAVGCEVCHGPGRAHVESVDRTGLERYRELRRTGQKDPTIWSGRGTQEEEILQCDQCHDFFTETTVSWVPGPHGFDRPARKRPITPDERGEVQFYADGSHKSPCSMGQVFRATKMYAAGVRCSDCHDPHGTSDWADLKRSVLDNSLCVGCHDHEQQFPDAESQARHSRHAPGSPGNRCVECHMPRHMIFSNGVEMMSDRIFRHDFSVPTGLRRPGGPPPSCNVCHTDRDDSWTRAVLEAWREGTPPPR
jgi:predicted CXXCH cytochrome family protein